MTPPKRSTTSAKGRPGSSSRVAAAIPPKSAPKLKVFATKTSATAG